MYSVARLNILFFIEAYISFFALLFVGDDMPQSRPLETNSLLDSSLFKMCIPHKSIGLVVSLLYVFEYQTTFICSIPSLAFKWHCHRNIFVFSYPAALVLCLAKESNRATAATWLY